MNRRESEKLQVLIDLNNKIREHSASRANTEYLANVSAMQTARILELQPSLVPVDNSVWRG